MPDYTSQLHLQRTRHRIKLPRRRMMNGYSREEFATREERSERLATLAKLGIASGVNKLTDTRDGKMVFVLTIPRGTR